MSQSPNTQVISINQHYVSSDLDQAVSVALAALGKDGLVLTLDDLAPIDQFHTGGKDATHELARRAGIGAEARVLDVGGGLGGAARVLASEFGCQVTVLDLTEEYCWVGRNLTERMELSDHVTFQHGNALDMPFEDSAFDVVWTQHSSMNVSDKERLYAQIHRVLRPGGRFAMHEILAGLVEPIHLPVFWAREASISFLRPPNAVRALLTETGFRELDWVDTTDWSLAWLQARLAAVPAKPVTPSPLGLHLLLGPDVSVMFRNHVLNLQENRISIIQGVFEPV